MIQKLGNINQLEILTAEGRLIMNLHNIELLASVQDEGKTLKLTVDYLPVPLRKPRQRRRTS